MDWFRSLNTLAIVMCICNGTSGSPIIKRDKNSDPSNTALNTELQVLVLDGVGQENVNVVRDDILENDGAHHYMTSSGNDNRAKRGIRWGDEDPNARATRIAPPSSTTTSTPPPPTTTKTTSTPTTKTLSPTTAKPTTKIPIGIPSINVLPIPKLPVGSKFPGL